MRPVEAFQYLSEYPEAVFLDVRQQLEVSFFFPRPFFDVQSTRTWAIRWAANTLHGQSSRRKTPTMPRQSAL